MKATIRGYYTYPSSTQPRKWRELRRSEQKALEHFFGAVKTDFLPYTYVRECILNDDPKLVMAQIAGGLLVAPAKEPVRFPKGDFVPKKVYKPIRPTKRGVRLLARAWDMKWPILVVWVLMIGAMMFWPEKTNELIGWDMDHPNLSPVRFTEEELKEFYDNHGVKKAQAKVLGASAKGIDVPAGREYVAEIISKKAKEYGVSETLMMAMAKCESGFNPKAANKVSTARGVYQFLSSTWAGNNKMMGYVKKRGLSWTLEDRFDAEKNIDMAAYVISKGGLHNWKADPKSYECWGWAEHK